MTISAEARQRARLRSATLDNGLKVLVLEEHTAPLASVWCWYKVGSKDERPGLTGVSHWVEHMNFKGTTNIPRDQVKGIIEQFGGSWNGYTWVDQTTYLETATRDALDRMLFIESERMARCLYHPDDCESERTVIISELKGGENDPDQLLDQEVTATALQGAHIPASDHRLAVGSSDDDPRGLVRLLPPLLRSQQRDARRCRRRGDRGCLAAGRTPLRSHPGWGRTRQIANERTRANRRTPRHDPQGRHGGISEGRLPRARHQRPAVCPCPPARRGPHRREGDQPVVKLSRAASATFCPAVSRAGGAGDRLMRIGSAAADRTAVSLLRVGDGHSKGPRWRRWNPRFSMRSNTWVTRVSRRQSSNGRRRSSMRNWCSIATASRTSPISSVTSKPWRPPTCSRSVGSCIAGVTLEQVGDAARELFRASNRTIGWFDPLPIGESLKPQVSSLTPGV